MRKLKKNYVLQQILTKKFINYLIRNGKKSKAKKLLANCCLYADKLLKKKFPEFPRHGVKGPQRRGKEDFAMEPPTPLFFPEDRETKREYMEGNKKGIYSNRIDFHYRLSNFFTEKRVSSAENSIKEEKKGYLDCFATGGLSVKQIGKEHSKTTITKSRLYFYDLLETQKNSQTTKTLSELKYNRCTQGFPLLPASKQKKTALNFFQKAIYRIRPLIFLQKLRKGGRTRYIPRALSTKKGMFIALKWVINSSIKKHGKNFRTAPVSQSLANELMDCFLEQGNSWQKKEELHKLGAANKAFIRYNWW